MQQLKLILLIFPIILNKKYKIIAVLHFEDSFNNFCYQKTQILISLNNQTV